MPVPLLPSGRPEACRTHPSRRVSPLAAPALVAAALLLSVPTSARAYIDPGAGPLLWQMFLAGLAGAAYQLQRWFRKGKSRKKDDERGNE